MTERYPEQRGEPGEDRTHEMGEDAVRDRLYGEEDAEPRGEQGEESSGSRTLATPSGIDPKPIERQRSDLSHVPTVDAMGQDKKRPVVGRAYGPSKTRQATVWLGSVAVIVALFIGGTIAVSELDNPPAEDPDTAPWRDTDVPPARPL